MSDRADGERGVSPVAAVRKPFLSKKILTIGIVVVAGGVAVLTFYRGSNPPEEPVKEKLPTSLGSVVPYSPPVMVMPPATPAAISPPMHFDPPPKPPEPQPPLIRSLVPAVPSVAPTAPKPYMLSFADPQPSATRAPAAGAAQGATPATRSGGGSVAGAAVSGVSYRTSHVDGVQAGLLGDQTFLLMPGILPCTMMTAINSTFAGPVECQISQDIKPRGVVLLDRGSIIHGTYANNIQTGQARLFVQAEWVEDPVSGCFMEFQNAPIADTIGQAGVPGNVDPHNLERFGAAMLLTVAQGGESILQAALSKGNNTYLNFNSGNGLDTIASEILRKQIDIPPTITVHQGAETAAFVTRVLDFSPCYDLQIKSR